MPIAASRSRSTDRILIRMRAAALNYRDLMVAKGVYNPEAAARRAVLRRGRRGGSRRPGVTRVKPPATACAPSSCAGGSTAPSRVEPSALGGRLDGVLAGVRRVVPSRAVVPPATSADEEAAACRARRVTAWNALVTQGDLRAGDTVLVQGTGGVSLFALQFARCTAPASSPPSSSDDKLARAKSLGAARRQLQDHARLGQGVRELTGGTGVDHVVEVGGAGTLGESLRAVRPGGTISLIGVLAGGGPSTRLHPARSARPGHPCRLPRHVRGDEPRDRAAHAARSSITSFRSRRSKRCGTWSPAATSARSS